MQVKTFQAVDMKQALKLVKQELGPAAVIVSSRAVRRDGGLFGLLGRKVLEVTAAVDEPKRPEDPADVQGSQAPEASRPVTSRARGTGRYHDIWAVRQAIDPVLDEVRALREQITSQEDPSTATPNELRSDLAQIRTMLSSLVGSGALAPDAEGSAAQRLFYFLMGRGVDEPLARSLVQRIIARVDPGALGDLDRLKLNLAAEMRSDLNRAERGSAPRLLVTASLYPLLEKYS